MSRQIPLLYIKQWGKGKMEQKERETHSKLKTQKDMFDQLRKNCANDRANDRKNHFLLCLFLFYVL